MDAANELKQALMARIAGTKQPQLRWVVCKSVDWSNKTMDAVGVSDELEYYDIELGAGVIDVQPVVDSTCLIGIVEGEEANGFLLVASEAERIEIKANTLIEFNGGTLGSLVKIEALKNKLNALEQDINSLKTAISGWTAVPNDGGAALKVALSSYYSNQLTVTQLADLANNKIKQ